MLFAELCITAFHFVLFDVDGGVEVVLHKLFTDEDCVLIVVAFPRHKADEHVSAECKFAMVASRSVCKHRAFLNKRTLFIVLRSVHLVALVDDWMLIDAGGLVGTFKL